MPDQFDYDPKKSAWNLKERGFDFDYASRIFEGFVVEYDSPRQEEHRVKAVGMVDDAYLTVIYTWRGGYRRILSARPASRKERYDYDTQKS